MHTGAFQFQGTDVAIELTNANDECTRYFGSFTSAL